MTQVQRQRPASAGTLGVGLFVPEERWGWEYVDVEPADFDPGPEPEWAEPPPPDLHDLAMRHAAARERLPMRIALTGVVLLVAVLAGSGVIALVGLLAGGAWAALPLVLPKRRMEQAGAAWQHHRAAQYAAYEQHCRQRADWIAARHRDEAWRQGTAARFRPLTVGRVASRVDVFGDTTDGWASLLTTFGSSLLQRRTGIVLLDLSGEHVAGALIELARARGFTSTHVRLPTEWDRIPQLHGLTPDEAVDLLAEVTRGPWPKPDRPDDRRLHADLIRTVAEQLDGPLTFRRIAAGLRVLLRTYHSGTEHVLADAEVDRLTDHVDGVGRTERVQSELHALTMMLSDLYADAQDATTADPLAASCALTVIETESSRRRKKALDRFLFHRILHDLSTGGIAAGTVLVVAGAENLDLESLEALARQARRAGIRLVLFMEKLRDEMSHLLGRSNSATIFMRLGNQDEALVAANHVGKGHTFVLSQLTEQVGRAFTEGDSQAVGTQDGESAGTVHTSGTTSGTGTSSGSSRQIGAGGGNPVTGNVGTNSSSSSSTSRAESLTRSRSRTWQQTLSYSSSLSDSSSTTTARSYDFEREPTEFQSLAQTAFILVEPTASGRRVLMGDCNPGISLLERTARTPDST